MFFIVGSLPLNSSLIAALPTPGPARTAVIMHFIPNGGIGNHGLLGIPVSRGGLGIVVSHTLP